VNAKITATSVSNHLSEHVRGQDTPLSDTTLAKIVDQSKIKKIYKTNLVQPDHAGSPSKAEDNAAMVSFILGTMALKGS